MKGYDSHFILSEANKYKKEMAGVGCIALSSEKILSFTFDRFEFKDSFSFMSSSLESLIKLNKYKEGIKHDNLSDIFNRVSQHGAKWLKENRNLDMNNTILDLVTEKGIYPYNHVKDHEAFNRQELPSPESFYDTLKKEDIKASDYSRAKTVWNITS